VSTKKRTYLIVEKAMSFGCNDVTILVVAMLSSKSSEALTAWINSRFVARISAWNASSRD